MVWFFSLLLLSGIVGGQFFDTGAVKEVLHFVTSVCLAYIMIEVGLEFTVDKRKITSYGWDAIVATSAAVLPALFWFLYFHYALNGAWRPAVIAGLSSAPTSAGVLFAMLLAAGLGATWVFSKARTLAVLDDLVTILLLIPLQIVINGFEFQSLIVLGLIVFFIFASFRWQNSLNLPMSEKWMFFYGVLLAGALFLIKITTHIHLEILIPAFMLGCLIHKPKSHHAAESWGIFSLDTLTKGAFMLLVGFSFPKVQVSSLPVAVTIGHVIVLTLLSNLGKCFPALCFRKEVSLKERLALSIAMFPRGEVGAAVLLIGLSYGFTGYITTLALLSLALNLILTGGFIAVVIKLIKK